MEHAAGVVNNKAQSHKPEQYGKELPRRCAHEVTSLLAARRIVKFAVKVLAYVALFQGRGMGKMPPLRSAFWPRSPGNFSPAVFVP
jgi:hypothetical protein